MSTAETKVEKVLAVQPVRPIERVEKYIRKDSKDSKKGGKKEVGFNSVTNKKLNIRVDHVNNNKACDALFYNNRARAISYAEVDKFTTLG